ncbi:DODA-type extradiol aromatic ring-opening family dioxygenase [Methylocystis heyeri]|uniref:Dioxygenase n=1 Tax=Methylocystis heyeri TaxID=391905 RepID=A0A6B8KCC6_9HYPH|nr:class III extradiol ring-cleavage dioxygenase [Methylocystis heyeri]QGM44741.1 dioxygenase [Methylocystis heyeri]
MTGDARKLPTFFIPHGGGPWPFMDSAFGPPGMWDGLRDFLAGLPASLPARPKAVLTISAHWETPRPTVDIDPAPGLLFDYYGFPEHTYKLRYPAPGAPQLAVHVMELLGAAGLPCDEARGRGFDHGVFIPFMLIYPQADMPILQMSLQKGASVARHLAVGRALAPLREEGVLIVGSGMSYHNLREFFSPSETARKPAAQFDDWLTQAVEAADPAAREAGLERWFSAPGAKQSHPTPEHLEPLFAAAGAAGQDLGRRVFSCELAGKPVSAFRFG